MNLDLQVELLGGLRARRAGRRRRRSSRRPSACPASDPVSTSTISQNASTAHFAPPPAGQGRDPAAPSLALPPCCLPLRAVLVPRGHRILPERCRCAAGLSGWHRVHDVSRLLGCQVISRVLRGPAGCPWPAERRSRLMRRSQLLPAERSLSPPASGATLGQAARAAVLPASQPGGRPARAPGPRAPRGQSGSRARTAANGFPAAGGGPRLALTPDPGLMSQLACVVVSSGRLAQPGRANLCVSRLPHYNGRMLGCFREEQSPPAAEPIPARRAGRTAAAAGMTGPAWSGMTRTTGGTNGWPGDRPRSVAAQPGCPGSAPGSTTTAVRGRVRGGARRAARVHHGCGAGGPGASRRRDALPGECGRSGRGMCTRW